MAKNKGSTASNRSAVCIARVLKAEGFTPFMANEMKKYALKSLATPRQRERWKRIKKAFGLMVADRLDEADKVVLGKFIGTLQKMSFESGLRIGLAALLFGGAPTDEELAELIRHTANGGNQP